MGTQINMIGIFVEDIQRMVAFYRDVLGFEIDWDGNGPYAEFKQDAVRFSMYARNMLPALLGKTPSYPAGLNGTFEIAIELPTAAEADEMFHRVKSEGARVVYAPRTEPWGMRSSMVADPEGNLIEIGSWNLGGDTAQQ